MKVKMNAAKRDTGIIVNMKSQYRKIDLSFSVGVRANRNKKVDIKRIIGSKKYWYRERKTQFVPIQLQEK